MDTMKTMFLSCLFILVHNAEIYGGKRRIRLQKKLSTKEANEKTIYLFSPGVSDFYTWNRTKRRSQNCTQ